MSYRIWGLNPKCWRGRLGRWSLVVGRSRGGRAIPHVIHRASVPTTLGTAMC
jgi:hypothetical protein